MRLLVMPCAFTALIACSGSGSEFTAADEAMIDCLASRTVQEVTDTVKTGIEAGKSPDDLRPVQAEVTEANIEVLQSVYPDQQQQIYFEYQVARRLNAVQDALNTPDAAPEAQALMEETFTLAKDCRFGSTR
ncbi:MAG: hypothetical protein QNI84_16365 [Henriciella sp.]|nr:hypothetical protein [Henriciella sp.]